MKAQQVISIILAAIVWSYPCEMSAQRILSLEECREMALKNNLTLRNAGNDIQGAIASRKEAFTKYFPNISATGNAFNASSGLLQMDMGPGMSMSMLKNGLVAGVTATQPIFAGGQIVNGNRLAKLGVEISRLQYEQTKLDVLLNVEQLYWQLISLNGKYQTIKTVEIQLDRLNKDVTTSVNAGLTTRNDLLQVQLKQDELQSNKISLENNISVANMMLAHYIGMDGDSIHVSYDILTDSVPALPWDIHRNVSDALPATIGYKLLENNVEANRLQHKIAVGKNLPTVGVGAGYMYENLMDKSHSFGLAYVTVSIPITDWVGGSHAIRKQKIDVTNAENSLADNSELLVIGMRKAWNDLEDAHRQILIAKRAIEQSSENLRINENLYRAGTISMGDLLDAQTLFQQSQDRFIESYAQFRIKEIEYRQATGNTDNIYP